MVTKSNLPQGRLEGAVLSDLVLVTLLQCYVFGNTIWITHVLHLMFQLLEEIQVKVIREERSQGDCVSIHETMCH